MLTRSRGTRAELGRVLIPQLCLVGLAFISVLALWQIAAAQDAHSVKMGAGAHAEQPMTLIPLPPLPTGPIPTREYGLSTFVTFDESKIGLLMHINSYMVTVMLDGSHNIIRRPANKSYMPSIEGNRKIIGWPMYKSYLEYPDVAAHRMVKVGNKTIEFHTNTNDFGPPFFDFYDARLCRDPASDYFVQEEDRQREEKVLIIVLPRPVTLSSEEESCNSDLFVDPYTETRIIVPSLMAVVDGEESLYLAGEGYFPMPFVIKYRKGSGIVGNNKNIFVVSKKIIDDIRVSSADEIDRALAQDDSLYENKNGDEDAHARIAALIESHILEYLGKGAQ